MTKWQRGQVSKYQFYYNNLFNKFSYISRPDPFAFNNLECWSARELQEILGYTEWRNFLKVIEKAKNACENDDVKITDHFVEVNKMIEIGKGEA
jgi:DNA-damage-inducible protein D